jgi:SPP1 gp7 family putative phage head morphogenesis protein
MTDDIATEYFRAKSLQITGVLQQEILAKAQTTLLKAIRAGTPPEDVTQELDKILRPYLPKFDRAGRMVNIPHRLEVIARTNISDAINAGRTVILSDPETSFYLTGLQYSAILDDRVRWNHAAWHGVVKEADFWIETNREPPNGFNCRCMLMGVTVMDGQRITPDAQLPHAPLPDPGFV